MDTKIFGPNWRRRSDEAPADGVVELWREQSASGAPVLTPLSVWLFLSRNLRRIALVAALVAGALFVALFLVFDKYSALATIMVEPRVTSVTQDANIVQNTGADTVAVESLVQSYTTSAFLGSLVDKLGLARDQGDGDRDKAIEKLGKELAIIRRGATYVIDVSVRNRSSEQAAKIANEAARAIIDSQRQIRAAADEKVAGDIAGRLDEVSARVNSAERAAAELKARLKVTDAGQGATLLERRVSELNQQLVLASGQTAEARARFEQLRRAGPDAELPSAAASSAIGALRADYARLTRQAADQATVLGALHPAVAALKAQIADIRRQIAAELGRMVDAARREVATAEQREAALARQLKEAESESGALGPELVKLDELQREAKAERSVYEQLLNRQRQLVEAKDLAPSDILLVSAATPPDKIKPGLSLRAAGSAVLGLLAALAYALAREIASGALTTPRQAERAAGVEVAGLAPTLSAAKGGPSPRPDLTPWLSELCSLPCLHVASEARVLLIASAFRGAGRTAVANGCAAYFAEGGARVLLIRADRPSTENRPRFGLIDVLERGEDLRRAFVENAPAGYTVLPFGGRDVDSRASTSALMSGVTLRALMRLCRQWFDIVVIDGPPALESAHAQLLARQADLTVLVAEWHKTTAAEATEAIERLGANDAVIFFNKVDVARMRKFDPAESRRMEAQADELSLAS